MQPINHSISDEPCNICGDVGFSEVIETCSKCKVAREHVYCMESYPKQEVAEDWICESCLDGNDTISPKYAGKRNIRDFGLDASGITDHEIANLRSPDKAHNSGRLPRSQEVVGRGKVKFIPEDEAIRLSSSNLPLKPFPTNSSLHRIPKTYVQSKNVPGRIPSSTVKRSTSLLPMGHARLPRFNGARKSLTYNQRAPHSLSKDPSKENYRRENYSNSTRPLNQEESSRAKSYTAKDKELSLPTSNSLPGFNGDPSKENYRRENSSNSTRPLKQEESPRAKSYTAKDKELSLPATNSLPGFNADPSKVNYRRENSSNSTKDKELSLPAANSLPGFNGHPSKENYRRENSSNSTRPPNQEESSRAKSYTAKDKELSLPAANSLPGFNADLQVEKYTKKAPCEALQTRQSSTIVDSGGTFCANKYDRSDLEERDLQSFQKNFKLYHRSLPSSHATWRGEFKFLQSDTAYEIYDGLEAQPPYTVHREAYDFSCKMPSVLEVNLLPVSSLLKDLFQNKPGLEDVALYFFPSDNSERSRCNLNRLFYFLDAKNLMLRSSIGGVELLVFTPKQLNVDSQGTMEIAHTKYFLWGLFRIVKNDTAIERFPDTEVVDMGIDMVGGNVVGRIDIASNPKFKPKNFSIRSEEGTLLQNTSKKINEKSSVASSIQEIISLPNDLIKTIKTELPSDVSRLNSVKESDKIIKKEDVPPGFERVHGDASKFENSQPPKFKRVSDLYQNVTR